MYCAKVEDVLSKINLSSFFPVYVSTPVDNTKSFLYFWGNFFPSAKQLFICSKVAVPYLTETKGVILNTSSMVSRDGQPSGVMYPASKYAVNGITQSLSRELAPLGIRVNAVAPGITETEMVSALPKNMIEPLIKSIPLGRIGTPTDIANAFVFLASDMASYITGDVLRVDGAART